VVVVDTLSQVPAASFEVLLMAGRDQVVHWAAVPTVRQGPEFQAAMQLPIRVEAAVAFIRMHRLQEQEMAHQELLLLDTR
jgi:hypothetical protein